MTIERPAFLSLSLLVLATMVALFLFGEPLPEIALAPGFTAWPDATLPVFVAMMFSGTLCGNATLIGVSTNGVAVGICTANRRRVTFMQFLRIGLPIAVAQLSVGAPYVFVLHAILGQS